MILVCGIPSEPPVRLVLDALRQAGADVLTLNQRQFGDCSITLEVSQGRVGGRLRVAGDTYPLARFTAAYFRTMDDAALPELAGEAADGAQRRRWRGVHEALIRWIDIAPGCMVNRSWPSATNMSKPFQAQIIRRFGLRTPETLITSDPEAVRAFQEAHAQIIYKSISGIRSIVRAADCKDFDRLDRIRWCPTQFQALVEGTELRVHVVGTEAFAAAVRSDATDYRYAVAQTGIAAELRPVLLEDDLADRCVRLTRGLGMEVAGIDLKVTPQNEVYCFEVNPSPAFSYYQQATGLPIAEAIARHLISG